LSFRSEAKESASRFAAKAPEQRLTRLTDKVPGNMSDLLTQAATFLLDLLATRKISALELAELHIERILALNPLLGAISDFDPDLIREQAIVSDAAPERGLLHGLPMTIKSSISVAGRLCESGSLANRGLRPREDAEAVKRLRAAGAVILGTTNCPEFLMAYETDNLVFGRTSNPWNLGYSSGGSSGGEAAAIAAGLSAGGLGSDGGGSVRTPAHATGICALKPTPGRIPGAGHLPPCAGPFSLLGAIGPMARTMPDVELLFRVASGYLEGDPAGAPVAYAPVSLMEARTLTIGYFEDDGLTPVTPETRQAVQSAAKSLQARGFQVQPFRPEALEAARKLWYTLFVQCGAMLLEPASGAVISPIFTDFLKIAHAAGTLTATELLAAWAEIDHVRGQLLEEMRDFPILLCPACAIPAFRHGEREWLVDGERVEYLDAMRYTQWFNLLGAPAAVVPVGRSPEGLPIGVQIAGRPWRDEQVLAVARVVDAEFGYARPPLAAP
jgi:Asp-tRNA(Asn)/Glu-tRNA(Gln) amidotransferase A subunit family amidase